ncbi:glycosyltransferase family 4 protein [Aeromicrobium wangtongii]|uniref:Glycosyltransferase family 4 protein n=1 Tax=Aeromicrobium wangtongii TaxID=2969247 RepID=A0ABY5M7N2_9ACTN|nr:glycosyltransferase family 4 protein [Aeromicrobium wangtongii]MCD9198971.1 glycosyltransferase family 4 protein [Aeromicrobium wangtongii]UUP12993.1 glycosyltransferase family 4 protein [Aeromicrobium wangtongii]
MGELRSVRVLTIGPAPSGPDSRGGMASVLTLMAAHPDPRVAVRVVATYVDRSLPWRVWIGVRGMLWSTALIVAGRVDVLHVHLSHGGSVVRKSLPLAAARLRGTATVVHAHSYDFAGWFDRLPAWGRTLVRRGVAADRWLVLATQHVDELGTRLHLPAERLEVLHNPVVLPDREKMARAAAPGGVVHAVSLGRLGHRKGSYDVVAAVATLPAEVRSRLRIVLAGDGEIEQVRRAVADADVAGVVEVRGWQGPAERDELMRVSQVFLLPSHEEGLPMALLEAMAHGLAPLVSPVGGIPDVVGDGVEGLLVPAGDIEGLGKALRRLVEDDDLRTRIAGAAEARSAGFDVRRWHDRLTGLWIDLAGRRRPARPHR